MDEEKLKSIIQRMMDNNEPPEKIREAVKKGKAMMAKPAEVEEVVEEEVVEEVKTTDPFKPAGLSEEEYTSTKEFIKEIPSTKKPEVKEEVVDNVLAFAAVKEKEVVKDDGKKDISFKEFNNVSEEDLVIKLRKQYGMDRFEFDQDTPGSDVLQIYDNDTKKYHHLPLNTEYNRKAKGNVGRSMNQIETGKEVYAEFLRVINSGNDENIAKVKRVNKEGEIRDEYVDKTFTGKSGSKYFYDVPKIQDNPYVKTPDNVTTVRAEVPQYIVDQAIDELEKNPDLTDMDSAIKVVVDKNENMQGALNFQNMMSQQEDQEQKKIATTINETIAETGNENIDFNANPFDGFFEQSLAEVDEMGGMVDMTQESFNHHYIYSNYAQNIAAKDEIINKYHKLGLPQWDHEAKYQQAKVNWEIAEGLRDPEDKYELGNTITQPKTSQLGEKATAYEMYATLASERAQYLKGTINTWLNDDPIGQQVSSAYLNALQEKTSKANFAEARSEIEKKYPDASEEEINWRTQESVDDSSIATTRNAWIANAYNESIEPEDQKMITTFYDKFQHRVKQLQGFRDAATAKYIKEGKRPDVARELANEAFPLTKQDLELQEQYLAFSQNLLDDNKVDIMKMISGDYKDERFNFNTEEDRTPEYYTEKIKEAQYYNRDYLDSSIYQNQMELLSLAPQLLKRNLEWLTESSVAQRVYNAAGEAIGSDQALSKDIERFEEMVRTGKLPDNLTTIPNSDSPLVKAWNSAVENRAVLGMSKMLNLNLATMERESAAVTMTNLYSSLDMTSLTSPNKVKRIAYELMQDQGIELTKEEIYDMEEHHAGLERSMDMVPGLTVMGGEMVVATLASGGAATVPTLIRGITTRAVPLLTRLGLSTKAAKSVINYATLIGAETYALQFSSEMEGRVFDKKDVMSFGHNIRLAATLNLGRGLIAKSGEVYSKAIINTAKKQYKQGNKALWNYIKWEKKTAGIESLKGMMGHVVTTPLTAATLLQAEGGIEAAWGGEQGWDEIWHGITDSQTLIETYGAMLTMQLTHPNATRKQIIERFRRDIDRFRGDNPAWNSAYRSIGLKGLKGDKFYTKGEVDQAIGEKIQEIEASDKPAEQKQQEIDYYKSVGKKLNMKPTMVQLGRQWDQDFLESKNVIAKNLYDDKEYEELNPKQKKEVDKQFKHDPLFERFENLQITSQSLQAGNALDATDMMNIAASGAGNGNQSPITELIRVGFDPKSATDLTTWATQVAADVRSGFSQNPAEIASKTGRKYTQNIIDINRREFEIISLKESLKGEDGLIAKHGKESKQVKDVEAEVERLEKSIELIDGANIKLSETQWEKENILDLETIEDAKAAGAEVIEMNNKKEVDDFIDNYPGELKKTTFGYYGRDKRKEIWNEKTESFDENPNYDKSIFIINKKAIKEGGAKGTVIHEIGHAATDVIVGDSAINERAKQIQKENPNMPFGAAKKLATNEKLEYIDNVRNELKKRDQAHYDKVEEQMMEIPGYEKYKKSVEQGGERDIFREKEFLTEFIQLASQKAFAGSKGIQGEIKEVTSLTASSKPSEFVDFVLKGGMTAKGGRGKAIEQTIKDIDVKDKKYGTKDSKVSASEKIIKENNIKISKENVKINEEILNSEEYKKSLERGKEEVPKEYKDRLVENNIARVKQLAGRAANNPNFFGEGVTYDSWLSGYKKELTALSNTYKPSKNPIKKNKKGEVISRGDFGAYMNKNLPLRYGDVIKELTAGETKGPKVRFGESTTEGGKKFDLESSDLSPEELMIAKEDAARDNRRESKYSDKVSTKKVFTGEKGGKLLDTYKGKVKDLVDKTIKTEVDKILKANNKLSPEEAREKALEVIEEKISQTNFKGNEVADVLAELIGIRPETITKPNENIWRPKQDLTKKYKGKKKIGEKGVEWGEAENVNRFLDQNAEILQAQLAETQLHPEGLKGNEKPLTPAQIKRAKVYGKQRVGKSSVGGTSLKLPPVLIKKGSPLYESSDVRSGTKEGTKIKQFKENLRTDINAFKEAIGIRKVKPGEVLKTDRKIEQLQKGLIKFLNDKIVVELAAEYIESLPIAEKSKKGIVESLKGGNSRFSPSEKIQKDFYRKSGKNISLERLEKAQNDFLDLRKQMALEARDPELYETLEKHLLDITEAMQGKARNTNYISTVKAGTLDKTFINDFAKKFKLTKKDAANLLNKITEQKALEYTINKKKYWRETELKEFQSSMLDMVENFFPKEMIDGLTIGQVEQLVGFAERVSAKGKELGISNKQRDISFNKAKLAEENSRLSDKTKKLVSEVDWKNIKVQNIQGVFNSYNKKIQEGLSEKKAKFEALKKLKPGERANYEKAQEAITSLKQDYIDFYSPKEKGKTQKLEKALKYIYNLNKGNTNMVKGQRGNVWTEWFYVTEGHQGPSLKNPLYKKRYNEALKFTQNKENWNKLVKNWKAKDQKVKTKEEYAAQKAKDFSKLKGEHLNPSAGESGRETLDVFSGKSGKPRTARELLDNVQYQAPKGILDIVDKAFGATAPYATKRLALAKLTKYLKESYSWDAIEGKNTETLYDRVLDVARTDLLNLPGGKEIFKNKKLLENPNLKNAILEYGLNPSEANKLVIENKIDHIKNYNEIGKNTKEIVKEARMSASEKMSASEGREKLRIRDKAFELARKINKPVKKARVFDFDDTVARTKSNVLYEMPNGKKGKISAEEFAKRGGEMEAKGAKWDFSEFNKVVDGKKGPLFEVMKKMKEAAGERDMFILTARSPEAAKAIQKFLKEMGVDIPLENIKGLADSSPYAKSDWILEKASEGYNDFYFADDHAPNVKAVREVLEQIDVKSKVQQARMSASEKLDKDFNKILEEKSGIEFYKEFSKSKGKVVGARKGKYKIFLPPGAEDFTGLIYPTLGKGKKGEAQLEWYNDNLIKPYNRATRNLSTDKVQLMNDFKGLKKQLDMPKDLRKITKSGYTKEQAARVYLWDKMGEKIPNLTKTDLAELLDIVNSDGKLKAFADQILEATKGDGYSTPGENWLSGTMTTDLIDVLNVNKRKKYLEEWQENIDIIYSEKNLNKLEAIYGPKYREALENSIKRMKTGRNRTSTGNKASDALLDYINGAQGTIMFLNMRSAVLQSISAANFVNLSFNNPIKAGRAFLNQKQYWKDFMSIMNSDYLVGRRQGLKLNISESEIADAAAGSKNKAKAAINYILEKGYAPTKFMDSFAIASGGATWYRNKIKDLIKKEGLSEVEAQKKAFEEFMEISEKSQQSSDPSKISKQQASDMGRIFLQFANTPMQYARIQKRALQDLANKRGDWKSNIGKILYYGVIQNIWFNAMQQGLFALGFGDDEINEKEEKKIVDTANGMADSILRGTGFAGMTFSVLKNTVIDLYRRSGRQQPKYGDAWMKLLEFSPAVKSKFGKLKSAAWPFDTKKGREEIKEKGFSLDNPAFESGAKVISAATNIPLDRLFLKYNNLKAMMSEDTETWKDIALFLGWPEYQLEEGGTVEEDNIRNMKNDTKKDEQIQMLLDLGYSKRQIRSQFKKEEDRVKAIINSKSGKKVKRKRVIY